MEFLQQTTFTAFLALVLSFLVAKIVCFAVSRPTVHVNAVVSSVSEGAVAKEVTLDRKLAVRRGKGVKRVKFVDDVVIRMVDRHEVYENHVLLDDVREMGQVVVEEKSVDEKSGESVDQFQGDGLPVDSGDGKSEEECSGQRGIDAGDARDEGNEKEADGDDRDGVIGENVEALMTSGVKSVSGEELKRQFELEGDDMVIDEREGSGENKELAAGDAMEVEKKVRYENIDDDWEGVERSELEKGFAEAVNYVECGGKDKEDDRLVKLGSDVQTQLYGLHKVALEGPCREPQPMALMLSARAKWNAWQRLGGMSRDVAMEQYIEVLSENVPEWMHNYADDDTHIKMETENVKHVAEHERESKVSTTPVIDSSTSLSSVDEVNAV